MCRLDCINLFLLAKAVKTQKITETPNTSVSCEKSPALFVTVRFVCVFCLDFTVIDLLYNFHCVVIKMSTTRSNAEVAASMKKIELSISSLTESVDIVKEQLKQLQDSVNSVVSSNKNLDTKVTNLGKNFSQLEESIEAVEIMCNNMHSKHNLLLDRVISMENQSRRDNLLFDGIPESPNETLNDCFKSVKSFFTTKLLLPDVDKIRIVRCHRLGPPRTTSANSKSQPRPRTVIVKFHWFADRQAVWEARKNLKQTDFFISEDFAKETVERRKTLLPIMKAAQRQRKKAFLVVDKLHIVNGSKRDIYDVNTLNKLPDDLDPRFVSTQKKDDVLAFFGFSCPLSNFHPSPFWYRGRQFRWVEEFFFHTKAELSDDQEAIQRLIDAESPVQCKHIGRSIKSDKVVWSREEVPTMERALTEKFTQNKDLKDFLLNTGDLLLAEASPSDKFWGTGIGLGSEDTNNPQKWKGKNKLGELLMALRSRLR